MARSHFLQPLLRRTEQAFMLTNARTGLPLATSVETAFSSAERRKGLLGRDGLPPGHALVIAPTNLVHTFSMQFAIDLVFVRRDGRVTKVHAAVPPRRISGSLRAFGVIEMAAGEAAKSGTRPGDRIEVGLAGR